MKNANRGREWLRQIRKEKGLTMITLGELLRCTPNYLSEIEHGKKNPSLNMAFELAILLEFDVFKFYEGDVKLENNCHQTNIHEGIESR